MTTHSTTATHPAHFMDLLGPPEHAVGAPVFEVFPWNDNFNTGNALIDQQHKRLVDLLNQLAGTLVSNQECEVEAAFAELAAYADVHFSAEEEIWVDCFGDDLWLHNHQAAHGAFLPKVQDLKRSGGGEPLYQLVEGIVKFLIRWLAFHIIVEDKRFALVVAEVQAGVPLDEAKLKAERKMGASSVRLLIDTVLGMYESLSSRTLNLLRERRARVEAEEKLRQAYIDLEAANRRLEESAITDDLTGLFNRRHFDAVFTSELARARREGAALTLALLDLDHFKRLNDTYGHVAGDEALVSVAAALREHGRRAGDFAFRLGGEEFALLACSSSPSGRARELFEAIRRDVEALAIPNTRSATAPTLTVSIGALVRVPQPADTVQTLFLEADRLLYEAKQQGRNRIVCG
ncbi:GGDEF domain-containing protein [Rubrivivax gelatinosus]|uniref:diguanylate cyclase n=1 Tax=Rubrivivax gelatinosus TaxID=28068 RepID=A0A4R2M6F8_RUBGE|nr:diguanylate cyclase [Rubrivivax gelatinosus]MBK1690175.1 GGDEF domain-containing protein [Rubrivivax gelatinosus]TCP01671.1 diguanylate cyclase (GGDEF)-like protein/hemerythrin-like metal-binding protein [Rubrivivax gelatinosus]